MVCFLYEFERKQAEFREKLKVIEGELFLEDVKKQNEKLKNSLDISFEDNERMNDSNYQKGIYEELSSSSLVKMNLKPKVINIFFSH